MRACFAHQAIISNFLQRCSIHPDLFGTMFWLKKIKEKPWQNSQKKASDKVEKAMHERKKGTLRSGSGNKVTTKEQAITIGLSEAREEGAQVPEKR